MFADKECFVCGDKGDGAWKCPDSKQKQKDSEDSLVSSSSLSKRILRSWRRNSRVLQYSLHSPSHKSKEMS